MQYVMTKESMTLMLATRLLEQCTTFYEPPVGMDPDCKLFLFHSLGDDANILQSVIPIWST